MASDDGDILVGWVGALKLRDETRGADNIESGNTEEALWVVDVFRLEDLGADWDGGIDLIASITFLHRSFM